MSGGKGDGGGVAASWDSCQARDHCPGLCFNISKSETEYSWQHIGAFYGRAYGNKTEYFQVYVELQPQRYFEEGELPHMFWFVNCSGHRSSNLQKTVNYILK